MGGTKSHLQEPVTKEFVRSEIRSEIRKSEKRSEKKLDKRFEKFKEELQEEFTKVFVTKEEYGRDMISIHFRFDRIEEQMYTKKDHEAFMILMDEMVSEVRAAREERILRGTQVLRMDDQLHNHENRIRILEKG